MRLPFLGGSVWLKVRSECRSWGLHSSSSFNFNLVRRGLASLTIRFPWSCFLRIYLVSFCVEAGAWTSFSLRGWAFQPPCFVVQRAAGVLQRLHRRASVPSYDEAMAHLIKVSLFLAFCGEARLLLRSVITRDIAGLQVPRLRSIKCLDALKHFKAASARH